MPRLQAIDNETGQKIIFDWQSDQPPTQDDMAEVFAASRKQVQPKPGEAAKFAEGLGDLPAPPPKVKGTPFETATGAIREIATQVAEGPEKAAMAVSGKLGAKGYSPNLAALAGVATRFAGEGAVIGAIAETLEAAGIAVPIAALEGAVTKYGGKYVMDALKEKGPKWVADFASAYAKKFPKAVATGTGYGAIQPAQAKGGMAEVKERAVAGAKMGAIFGAAEGLPVAGQVVRETGEAARLSRIPEGGMAEKPPENLPTEMQTKLLTTGLEGQEMPFIQTQQGMRRATPSEYREMQMAAVKKANDAAAHQAVHGKPTDTEAVAEALRISKEKTGSLVDVFGEPGIAGKRETVELGKPERGVVYWQTPEGEEYPVSKPQVKQARLRMKNDTPFKLFRDESGSIDPDEFFKSIQKLGGKIDKNAVSIAKTLMVSRPGTLEQQLAEIEARRYVGGLQSKFANRMASEAETLKTPEGASAFVKNPKKWYDGLLNMTLASHYLPNLSSLEEATAAGVNKPLTDAAFVHMGAAKQVGWKTKELMMDVAGDASPEDMAKFTDLKVKDRLLAVRDQWKGREAENQAAIAEAEKSDNVGELKKLRDTQKQIASVLARQEERHDYAAYEKEVQTLLKNPVYSAIEGRFAKSVVPYLDGLYLEATGRKIGPMAPRGKYTSGITLASVERADELAKMENGEMAPSEMGRTDERTLEEIPRPEPMEYARTRVSVDPKARMAKGTGDYSTDLEAILKDTLMPRWNSVSKRRFLNELDRTGMGKVVEPGEPPPLIMGQKGVYMPNFNLPEVAKNGKVVSSPKNLYVHPDVVGEIKDVLGLDIKRQSPMRTWGNAVTQLQLLQIADASTHAMNVVNEIALAERARGLTFSGEAAWKTAAGGLTHVKSVYDVGKIWHEGRSNSPAYVKDAVYLADRGLLRSDLKSKGGLGRRFINEMDTSARILMLRIHRDLVKAGLKPDTEASLREMVLRMGQYNERALDPLSRTLRNIGLAPFVVAGKTFNEMALKHAVGWYGHATKGGMAALRAQQVSQMATAAVLIPAALNTVFTGTPFGRKGTPVGAVDLGGKMDAQGHFATFDLWTPLRLRRAAGLVGVKSALAGVREGHTAQQMLQESFNDLIVSWTHPFLGPLYQAVSMGTQGQSPAFSTIQSRRVPEKQVFENIRFAAEQTNPVIYGVVEDSLRAMGAHQPLGLPATELPGQTGTDKWKKILARSTSGVVGYKETIRDVSAAQKMIYDYLGETGKQTQEELNLTHAKQEFAKGNKAPAVAMLKSGQMSVDQLSRMLVKQATKPRIVSDFSRIPVAQKEGWIRVMETARKNEFRLLLPEFITKVENALEKQLMTPEQAKDFFVRMKKKAISLRSE